MAISIKTQRNLLPQIGEIARYGSNYCIANLRYRITSHQIVGNLVIPWGLRVKWDSKIKDWVSFGKERALMPYKAHKFNSSDSYYFRDMAKVSIEDLRKVGIE